MSIRILGRHQSWEVMSIYRGSTDPCLYGRYHHQHHSINTAISIRPLCSFIRNSFCTDQSVLFQAMWTGTETPESSGNYTSHSDPLQLLQGLSDTLWHCCWEPSPVAWLHILVWWGRQQGHLCVGEQRRVPGCEAQPLQLYLPDRETWDGQWGSASWSVVEGANDRTEQSDGNASVVCLI